VGRHFCEGPVQIRPASTLWKRRCTDHQQLFKATLHATAKGKLGLSASIHINGIESSGSAAWRPCRIMLVLLSHHPFGG
jgi:hypothetical protein